MSEEMIPVLAQRKIAPTVARLSFSAPIMLGRKTKIHSIEAVQLCWGCELGMRYTKEQLVFRGLDTFSIGFEGPTVKIGRDSNSGVLTLMLVGGDRGQASRPAGGGELTVQLEFYHYNDTLLTGSWKADQVKRRLDEEPTLYRLWASRKGRVVAACPCSGDPDSQLTVAKDWLAQISSEPKADELTYTIEYMGV